MMMMMEFVETVSEDPKQSMPDLDNEPTPEQSDEYIRQRVLLPRGEGYQRAIIAHRKRDSDGNLIVKRNPNPILA